MPARSLSTLGRLVREKRAERKMREVAVEIGISPATLLRIEAGRLPDISTFGRVCTWLGVDPGDFLGKTTPATSSHESKSPLQFSAHFRAERTPKPETIEALARMILLATRTQAPKADL